MTFPHGLEAADDADLVVAPAYGDVRRPAPSEAVLDVFRRAHARGAWVLSVCSGAFLLGHAGLLDGRACTTHWRHTDELRELFPAATHRPRRALRRGRPGRHQRRHRGRHRRLPAPRALRARRRGGEPDRASDGGAAAARRRPAPVHRPAGAHLRRRQPLPAAHLDARAPRRGPARARPWPGAPRCRSAPSPAASRAETGTTPGKWLLAQRLHHARELLESTDLPVETVATRAGFGSAALLRHHFGPHVGVAPAEYRRTFRIPGRARRLTRMPVRPGGNFRVTSGRGARSSRACTTSSRPAHRPRCPWLRSASSRVQRVGRSRRVPSRRDVDGARSRLAARHLGPGLGHRRRRRAQLVRDVEAPLLQLSPRTQHAAAGLATSWKYDGSRTHLTVQPPARRPTFSNGQAVTAQDVVFSVDQWLQGARAWARFYSS